nr:sulfurtransferase [uncultured Psychroserpens sp.]
MLNNGRLISPIVTCSWLFKNIELKGLIILDAREKISDGTSLQEYIPQSRYFNIKENFSDTKSKFPNTYPSLKQFQNQVQQLGINHNSLIIVYDDKGVYWSPRVWWLFKSFGYHNVAVLNGGLPKWKQLNYKTVSTLSTPNWSVGNFIAKHQPKLITYFNDIAEISTKENYLILDARSRSRFNCETPEPRAGLRSGTIPNSKNLPYIDLLDGYCLKSKADLKTIFDTYQIEDKNLIFTCGSGITACIIALAAYSVNYNNISVYDGSWTEYGTLTK